MDILAGALVMLVGSLELAGVLSADPLAPVVIGYGLTLMVLGSARRRSMQPAGLAWPIWNFALAGFIAAGLTVFGSHPGHAVLISGPLGLYLFFAARAWSTAFLGLTYLVLTLEPRRASWQMGRGWDFLFVAILIALGALEARADWRGRFRIPLIVVTIASFVAAIASNGFDLTGPAPICAGTALAAAVGLLKRPMPAAAAQ